MKSLDKTNIVKEIKWFFKESPIYMSGHSKLYYWINLPKALIKFTYYTIKG